MAALVQIPQAEWNKATAVWQHGCSLYIVQEGGSPLFKVGIAEHPLRRLSCLQCGNSRELLLRAVFVGPRRRCRHVERILLTTFPRIRNEWLRADFSRLIEVASQ